MIPCIESTAVATGLAAITYMYNWFGQNMSEIVNGLWVGNIASAWDANTLKRHNINHVVCITQFGDAAAFYTDTLKYHVVKLQDVPESNIKDVLEDAAAFIHNAMSNGHPVLVHCNQGRSRSATVAAAYLIKYRRMDATAGLGLLRDKRPEILPNPGFIRQLYAFAEELHEAPATPAQLRLISLGRAVDQATRASVLSSP